MMDRATALRKLKACLALSKSPEAHEAAAAMRQAQKLMEQYGLEEDDVQQAQYGSEKVSCPIQANVKLPAHLSYLVRLITTAFGVTAVVETETRVSDKSYAIRYFGPLGRIQLAAYTHTVIYRAMNLAWTKHLKEHPQLRGERGARSGFFIGWIQAIQEQITALAMTDEEKERTALVKSNHYGNSLVKTKVSSTRVAGDALAAGLAAGTGFALHRPMQADKLKITR